MTQTYLAYCGADDLALMQHDWLEGPLGLLVAMPYLSSWDKLSKRLGAKGMPAKLMLDSGAWSAFQSGHKVDIDKLITEAQQPRWDEAVGLDVIGSWEGSQKNLDYMRAKGCTKAMPVFHVGEPWELLAYYCENWEKVGLACSMLKGNGKDKWKFYDQCFAKAWPHKFHSFGWTNQKVLMNYPFHSADSSSWSLRPGRFNMFAQFGKSVQFRRAKSSTARELVVGEVRMYADQQRRVQAKWSKELAKLDEGK